MFRAPLDAANEVQFQRFSSPKDHNECTLNVRMVFLINARQVALADRSAEEVDAMTPEITHGRVSFSLPRPTLNDWFALHDLLLLCGRLAGSSGDD